MTKLIKITPLHHKAVESLIPIGQKLLTDFL